VPARDEPITSYLTGPAHANRLAATGKGATTGALGCLLLLASRRSARSGQTPEAE